MPPRPVGVPVQQVQERRTSTQVLRCRRRLHRRARSWRVMAWCSVVGFMRSHLTGFGRACRSAAQVGGIAQPTALGGEIGNCPPRPGGKRAPPRPPAAPFRPGLPRKGVSRPLCPAGRWCMASTTAGQGAARRRGESRLQCAAGLHVVSRNGGAVVVHQPQVTIGIAVEAVNDTPHKAIAVRPDLQRGRSPAGRSAALGAAGRTGIGSCSFALRAPAQRPGGPAPPSC